MLSVSDIRLKKKDLDLELRIQTAARDQAPILSYSTEEGFPRALWELEQFVRGDHLALAVRGYEDVRFRALYVMAAVSANKEWWASEAMNIDPTSMDWSTQGPDRTQPDSEQHAQARRLIAAHYFRFAQNRMPLERELTSLVETFEPIRGCWGGLALAAWGYKNRGDIVRCRELLAQEWKKLRVEELEFVLPRLWQWMQDERPR